MLKLLIRKEEDYVLNFLDVEFFFDGIFVFEELKVVIYMYINYGDVNKLWSVMVLIDIEIWICGEDKMMKFYNL